MNANLRNFALWVIIVLLLLALFTVFQNPASTRRRRISSFSQLLNDVDQGQVRDVVDPGPGDPRHLHRRPQLQDLCAERSDAWCSASTARASRSPPGRSPRQCAVVRVAADLVAAVHRADRGVDFPVAPDAGRRRQGARLRQVAGQASDRGAWPRHLRGRGRRRRGQAGSAGDRRVPARSREVPAARRAHSARRAAGRPARHRQDACSPAPSPARPTCRSSRFPAPTSSRCSSASARAACATCSSRPRRTRPASSSSTRSTRSAAIAAPASAAAMTSASRRSTSCWSRWTASRPTKASS